AYSLLKAQEAQPLNYTWAIVLSILSVIILKQKIKIWHFIGLIIGFIGVFTILGFFIFWSDPNRRILLLFILTLAFSYIIFFVIGRLRQPVVPLFVLLCGCSIDWLILKISEKDIKALKIYIPLLILSTLLVWLPKYKYEIEWLNAMTESDHSIYLMYQKRFKESETLLRNIIKKDRNFAPAYNNLGNLYLRTGQVRKAIPYYNEAIKLDSTEGDYHANLGVAYLLTGQLELGERELKIGKKLLPYYLAIEDHLKQLYEISDATRLNPAEGYLIIAENAISIGDLDLAIEFFEKSLAIQPRSLRAINDGAVAYYQKKNFTRAIDLLIQGVEYFPDNIDLLYNLGIMYYEKGEKVNALAAWQKIIKIDPTNKRISELIEKTEKELKGTSSPKVRPK
ncbi:MAG: tetratricopeptide repeat protein, partial [candidate division WOR-3 bacterium]